MTTLSDADPGGLVLQGVSVSSRVDIRRILAIFARHSRPDRGLIGGVAERSKAADCKSAGISLRRFESYPLHQSFGFSNARIGRIRRWNEG